jgi:hypothetical protein
MGRINTYNGDTGSQSRILLRSGYWNHGLDAGAFALSLYWGALTQDYTAGLRCAQ